MAITLWLNPNDIPTLTAFSGNIDADSLKPHIYVAQTTDLKRVLGLDLYNKIDADFIADTLAGNYKIIYDNYIIDMLVYYSCAYYVSFNSIKISNSGNIKPDGSVDLRENDKMSAKYLILANNVVNNFLTFMKTISVSEFTTANENRNNLNPWY